MKRVKVLCILFLCLTIVASSFVLTVSATTDNAEFSSENFDENFLLIEKLEAMGMISNTYTPTDYVKRGEMADVITKFMRLNISKDVTSSPFLDVSAEHSSLPAINALYDLKVITGDDESNFRPDDYLTYDEAFVFVVNAIGHKMFALREGGYPTGYYRVAIKHNMLKGLEMRKGSDIVIFNDLYKILDNASNAAVVLTQYFGDGDATYTLSTTETFLSENYGIKKYRGKVTGNEFTRLTYAASNLNTEQIEITDINKSQGVVYDTPGYYYDYFLGYTVDYYLKDNGEYSELVYVEETDKSNTKIRINSEDLIINKAIGTQLYYYNEDYKEEKVSLDSTYLDVIYNNQSYMNFNDLKEVLPKNGMGYIELLDNNNDGRYDVLFVYEYENAVVKYADSYNERVFDLLTNSYVDLNSSQNKIVIRSAANSKRMKIEDIVENDVLSILKSRDNDKVIFVYVSRNIVDGQIIAEDSNLGYQVGDKYYEKSLPYIGNEVSVGTKGMFYLDMNDKIVTYKNIVGTEEVIVAVVTGIQQGESSFDTSIQLKVFTENGEFAQHFLNEKVNIDGIRYDLSKDIDNLNVCKKLTNSYPDGNGGYKVNETYVIMYTLNSDGNISEIDTGVLGGDGKLNTIVKDDTHMVVRYGGVMIMNLDDTQTTTHEKIYRLYDKVNGLIFNVPSSENIDNEKLYSIDKTLQHDRHYGNNQTVQAENYSVFNTSNAESRSADIVLFRGKSSSSEDGVYALVTAITDVADEDGMSCKKLYLNEEESALVETVITYTINGNTYQTTNADTVLGILGNVMPGSVIKYSTTPTGEIDTIELCTIYNETTKTLTPKFGATDTEYILEGALENYNKNFVVGEVKEYDSGAGLIVFTTNGNDEYILRQPASYECYMYETSRSGAQNVSFSNLKPGHKIAVQIDSYFAAVKVFAYR